MALSLNKTVSWFNKTEGRDKICKTIQYGSRLLMWHLAQQGNKELSDKFKNLFQSTRDARKLFRLWKSLNEIQKILELLNKKDGDQIKKILELIQRLWFALYWVFDNLQVLSSIKFLNKDPKPLTKTAATFWLLALITGLMDAIRTIIINSIKLKHLEAKLNAQPNNDLRTAIIDLKRANHNAVITLIKTFGDLIPAGQASEVIPKLFGKSFNDGWIGFGGLVSGSISAYQAY